MKRRRHLGADEMDVLLDLRNPLAEDGEQLGDGGARVSEDLPALRLAGVKEGELCGRRGEDAETKVHCNAHQTDRRNPREAPTFCRDEKAFHIKFPQQTR